MACNCGSKNKQTQQFVFVSPQGQQKVYKTEIEARAAKIRAGGGTITARAVR